MKTIAVLFSIVLCFPGLIFSQSHPTRPKEKRTSKSSLPRNADKSSSTAGLDFCGVVNDHRGGVWLTGNAFLLAGLMVNDRDGILNPRLLTNVTSVCQPIFVTAEVGWMVTSLFLYRTSDGGLSWMKSSIPGSSAISTVHFLDLQHGWAGGEAGEIYRTTDAGQSWKKTQAPLKYAMKQIFFVDALHGWAVGYNYVSTEKRTVALFRSLDGGETWQQLANGDADSKGSAVSLLFLDKRNGWGIEGWQHNVIRSRDGGETWTIQELHPKGSWNSIFFVDERHGWVVGKGIAHTSDGGVTWQYQIDPEASRMNFNGLVFIDAKRGWAIAYDKVLRTQDGGKTWHALSDDWQRMLPLDSLFKTRSKSRK